MLYYRKMENKKFRAFSFISLSLMQASIELQLPMICWTLSLKSNHWELKEWPLPKYSQSRCLWIFDSMIRTGNMVLWCFRTQVGHPRAKVTQPEIPSMTSRQEQSFKLTFNTTWLWREANISGLKDHGVIWILLEQLESSLICSAAACYWIKDLTCCGFLFNVPTWIEYLTLYHLTSCAVVLKTLPRLLLVNIDLTIWGLSPFILGDTYFDVISLQGVAVTLLEIMFSHISVLPSGWIENNYWICEITPLFF